jgi:hypothetical protein
MAAARRTRVLVSLAVVALIALAASYLASTFSSFSAVTGNAANTGTAGSVSIGDNDSGTALLTMTGLKPGDTDTGCITVTSTGTLASLVKLYGTTTGSGLDAYLSLVVTRGSGAGGFDDCTGFTADAANYIGQGAGVLYSGTLTAFPDSYAAGVQDPRSSVPEVWTTGESHTYRFALTLADTDAAQGLGYTQTFTWETRNTTLYSQVVLSDGPASYWKLDEAAGTSAADSAGSVTGTYTTSPTLNQTSMVRDAGTAVSFSDSVQNRVTLGDNYDFTGTASFSIELWMTPTVANTHYRRVVSKEGTGGWWFELNASSVSPANRLYFTRKDSGGGNDYLQTAGGLAAGTTYHIVVTYDGSNLRLYVNGALANGPVASSRSLPNTAAVLTLGNSSATGDPYGGLLDEVAIYTSALSATQVADHYNAGRR